MFTELEIDEIYLENIMFLYRFRDLDNQDISKNILEKINLFSEISVNELLQQFSSNKFEQMEIIPYIWQLVFLKKVNVNIHSKITNNTILKAS